MKQHEQVKAVLIDLDGTMVDSAEDLNQALTSCMQQMSRPAYDLEQTRQWIGNGLDTLLHRALSNDFNGKANANDLDRAREYFFKAYESTNGTRSVVYDGVKEAIENFKSAGCKVVCITNKSRQFTIPLLEFVGLKDSFDLILAGDDVQHKKPHPEALEMAMEEFSLMPEQCLMIGDSDNDITAANRAGVAVYCVDYGYSQGKDLSQLDIISMISSLAEIQISNEQKNFIN